jgi:hypothetical protein
MRTKHISILFFILLFAGNISGQEVAIDEADVSSVLNDYELTDKQQAAWKAIRNNWIVSDYEKVQAENNIKLNCKNCESFFIEVIIKVNASGKMEYYKLVNGKKCAIQLTKQLEIRMMRVFFKFEFPPELRNTTFRTKLGNVLKC